MSIATFETPAPSGRRTPSGWILLAAILLSLPVLSAAATQGFLAWAFTYYAGDLTATADVTAYRGRVSRLIERASYLQNKAGGGVGYAWDAAAEGDARRYLLTDAGTLRLDALRHVWARDGRSDAMSAGVVENGLGVVVVAVTSERGVFCKGLLHAMSPFAKARASAAWLSGLRAPAMPGAGDVASARWAGVGEALADCPSDGSHEVLLLRFDRVPGRP